MKGNDILQLPIVDKKNKVIDIVSSKELGTSSQVRNPVLIMAGGFGKRLLPLTKIIPKPLLKIGNERILDKIIENVKRYNFKKIFISVFYLSQKITKYAKDKKTGT